MHGGPLCSLRVLLNTFRGNGMDRIYIRGEDEDDDEDDGAGDTVRALLTAERPQPPGPPPAPSPAASPPPATDDDDAVESIGAAASTSEGLEDDNDDEECDVPDSLLDFLSEHVGDGPVDLTGVAAEEDKDEEKEAFTPITWDIDCNAAAGADDDASAKWIDAAAASLSHNGFCVLRLPTPIIPTTECSNLATSCVSRLNILFDLARKRGIEPKRDIMRFTEVCCRTPGGLRYDMRFASEGHQYHSGSSIGILPPLPSSWDELYSGVEAIVRPILTKQGNDAVSVDSAGCVTSLPRAPDQLPSGRHRRGPDRCFVPLVPVDQERANPSYDRVRTSGSTRRMAACHDGTSARSFPSCEFAAACAGLVAV